MTKERAVSVTIVEYADLKKWQNVNYNCLFGVSGGHLILGLIMICISAPVTNWKFEYNYIGYGIWSGVIFTATGVVGIVASKYKEYRALVMAYMVLSYLSVVCGIIVITLTSCSHFSYNYEFLCHEHCGAKKALSAVQICFGGVELMVAVFTSLNIVAEMFCHPAEHH